ncbi:hypothetical protein BJV74DRAFT_181592 [Russula compacta]|nr:hypothetical protein BJV74DRAFT_181592 [Russula compacta]
MHFLIQSLETGNDESVIVNFTEFVAKVSCLPVASSTKPRAQPKMPHPKSKKNLKRVRPVRAPRRWGDGAWISFAFRNPEL